MQLSHIDIILPLILLLVIALTIALISLWIILKHKPSQKYIESHKTDIRYLEFDYGSNVIQMFSVADFSSPDSDQSATAGSKLSTVESLSLSEFVKRFSYVKRRKGKAEGKDKVAISRNLQAFFEKAKAAVSEPLFTSLDFPRSYLSQTTYEDTDRKTAAKDVIHVLISVKDVDTDSKRVHLEMRLLPNYTLDFKRKKRRILRYDEYLRWFRAFIRQKQRICFVYVGLQPNPRAEFTPAVEREKEQLIVLLSDRIARRLSQKSYLIEVDNSSFMFVVINPGGDIACDKICSDIRNDVGIYLASNGMDDRYTPEVGKNIHQAKEPIQALAKYVEMSKEDALRSYLAIPQSLEKNQDPETFREIMERGIQNNTWRLYFNPYFDVKTGVPYLYTVKLDPFLSTGPVNADLYLEAARKSGKMHDIFEKMAEIIKVKNKFPALFPGEKERKLCIPCRLSYCEEVLKSSLTDTGGAYRLYLGFYAGEVERYGGAKFDELLSRAEKLGILPVLLLSNKPPAIDDETMSKFELFLVEGHSKAYPTGEASPGSSVENFSPVTTIANRADTMTTLAYLKSYGKPVGLAGLERPEECVFALINGFSCVSSSALCQESSRFESLDLKGQDIIKKTNAKQTLWR